MTLEIEIPDPITIDWIESLTQEELVAVLMLAKDAYYNDDPIMSDDQFDLIELILKGIDASDPYFQMVGSDVRTADKTPLPVVLGSLDQVYLGDTEAWIRKERLAEEDIVVTDKEDGMSILLVYGHNGEIKIAYSRGTSTMGRDITRHILKMANVPKKVSRAMMLRGEIIISDNDFERHVCLMGTLKGTPGFKNPRNYTTGQINRDKADAVFLDNAHVVAYEVVNSNLSKQEQIALLAAEGFTMPGHTVVKGKDLNDALLTDLLTQAKINSLFALDGIVLDVDSVAARERLTPRSGSSVNPIHAKKFKLNITSLEVIVSSVIWQISKLGYLKPRVQIEPVELGGVTITYATGFNAKFIRDNNIGPGAVLKLTRSGDVIPFIQGVVFPAPTPSLPTEAEYGEMYWTEGDVDLVLTADTDEAKLRRLIDMFVGIEVPHLRRGNMEKLFEAGFTTAESIILATEAQLKAVIGESAGTKIFEGIALKLGSIPMWKLAGSSQLFGRGIGRRKMKKLADAHGDILNLTVKQIAATDGFDTKTAQVVADGMPRFKEFLEAIKGYYSILEETKVIGGDLEGIRVCFTGVRNKDLEAKIEARGGHIASGVNAQTTHLVAKDPTANSSKLVKARELLGEDNIISEATAISLWG